MSRTPTITEAELAELKRRGRVVGDVGGSAEAPREAPASTADAAREEIKGPSEREIQKALFETADYKKVERPELRSLMAIPNGQYRPGQALEPGVRKGFPDIGLFAARPGADGRLYHALFVELKTEEGTARPEQKEWIARLRAAGYAARICYGYEEAWATIVDYLDRSLTSINES